MIQILLKGIALTAATTIAMMIAYNNTSIETQETIAESNTICYSAEVE